MVRADPAAACRGTAGRAGTVFDWPATVGQRYLRSIAPNNVEAGELIRTLPRTRADELELNEDLWLFDGPDPMIAILRFDHIGDVLTDISISRTPDEVAVARARWAAAWQASSDLAA